MKKVYELESATELAIVSAALDAAKIPYVVENEERLLEGTPPGPRLHEEEPPTVVLVPAGARSAARRAIRAALRQGAT